MDQGHDHEDLRIKQGGHRGRHDEHDLEDRGLALHGDQDEHHDEVHGVQGLVNHRTNTRATQFGEDVENEPEERRGRHQDHRQEGRGLHAQAARVQACQALV